MGDFSCAGYMVSLENMFEREGFADITVTFIPKVKLLTQGVATSSSLYKETTRLRHGSPSASRLRYCSPIMSELDNLHCSS